MLVITNPVQLYGRKVVTDLALRSGFPDAKSYSCQEGLSPQVDRLWSEATYATRESLFEKQSDFDADRSQPHLEEYDESEEEMYEKETPYNPSKDKLDFNAYFRRLEDIETEYLSNYVSNLVFTICRFPGGGVKGFNYRHSLQPALKDLEDGSATELADLELDYDKSSWSDSETKKALSQLPYVLRRFLNLSCYTNIHVLSFVCSYMLATDSNKLARQTGSTKSLKKNAVISENVWTCDSSGNAVRKVEISNKNLKAYELFDWMEGNINKYVTYRDDVTNFMHYVKVLNLDIADNMERYGSEFVRSLIVVTLTPNVQYNQSVCDALASGTIVGAGNNDAVHASMLRFGELCFADPDLREVIEKLSYDQRLNNFRTAKKIHYAYMMMQGLKSTKYNYEFYSGYLYCNGELAVLGCEVISDVTFEDGRVIISELGYCIAVSNSLILNLMTVYNAEDNLMNKLKQNKDDKLEGWWSVSL